MTASVDSDRDCDCAAAINLTLSAGCVAFDGSVRMAYVVNKLFVYFDLPISLYEQFGIIFICNMHVNN